MSSNLDGRVALVTGGGKDIGAAIAKDLAAAGARVAVNYTRGADTAAVVEEITAKGGRRLSRPTSAWRRTLSASSPRSAGPSGPWTPSSTMRGCGATSRWRI